MFLHSNSSFTKDALILLKWNGTANLSYNLFDDLILASLFDIPQKVHIYVTCNNLPGPILKSGVQLNEEQQLTLEIPSFLELLWKPCSMVATGASSPSTSPYLPSEFPPKNGGDKGALTGVLSRSAVIAIVSGDVI